MTTKLFQKLLFINSFCFVLVFTYLAISFRSDLFLRRVFLDITMCGLWFFGNVIGCIIAEFWLKRKSNQKTKGRLK